MDLHAEDELLVLSFDAALPLGEAILRLEFQGTLNDQMRGFYRRFCFLIFMVLICLLWNMPQSVDCIQLDVSLIFALLVITVLAPEFAVDSSQDICV